MLTEEEIDSVFGAEEETGEEESATPAEPADGEESVKEEESEETKEGEPEQKPEEEPDHNQLAERIAELEKINNGLLQAKTATAAKAKQYQEELREAREQLELSKTQPKKQEEPEAEDQPADKLPVEFDEDGNAFVPAKSLPVNKTLEKKVHNLELQLQEATTNLRVSQEKQIKAESLNQFLNEKDGYKEAYVQVKDQWEYISGELFDQFVESREIPIPKTQAEAMEIASSSEFQKAFKSKFPTGDAESVMEAYLFGGRYFERKALDAVLSKKIQSNHKQIPSDKPQPLSTVQGASLAGDDDDNLQKYADMPLEKFLELDPQEDARIDRLLKKGS